MSGKQVNIGPRPDRRTEGGAEAWVSERGGEPSKRPAAPCGAST